MEEKKYTERFTKINQLFEQLDAEARFKGYSEDKRRMLIAFQIEAEFGIPFVDRLTKVFPKLFGGDDK